MYIDVQTYTIQTAVPSLERPPLLYTYKIVHYGVRILNRHLSSKAQKFVLYWYNVGPIHVCGWTNIFDISPALIQHVLTVMYCVCWAHNRPRGTNHLSPLQLTWSQRHMIATSHDLNVQSEKSFHICRSWHCLSTNQRRRCTVISMPFASNNAEPAAGYDHRTSATCHVCWSTDARLSPVSVRQRFTGIFNWQV